jgi:hypothetical protein
VVHSCDGGPGLGAIVGRIIDGKIVRRIGIRRVKIQISSQEIIVKTILQVKNGGAVSSRKSQVGGCMTLATEGVHTIDHVLREWEGSPPVAFKFATSKEAHKIVATLVVTSRAEGYGASGARLHQIVMLFVGLNVKTKFQVTVFSIVQCIAGHKRPRAQSVRNAILGREHVEPKYTQRDHFLEHQN